MLKEIADIVVDGFNQYGLESVGYLIMGLCFGMFFIRSTQKKRFHLISLGCYILAFGTILLVILPSLVVLNPKFLISFKGYEIIQGITVSLGCSFLGVSLLVGAFGMSVLLSCVFLFFVIQMIFIHIFRVYYPEYNLIYWSLAACWVVVGLSFHLLRKVGKTSLFDRVGDAFFVLALYYIAREFDFVSGTGWLPIFIFGGVSIAVLMAQIKFMESTCVSLEEGLAKEKSRRTLFWDIAPFPILVSKLLDDSVIYINPMAKNMLDISSNEVSQFHLKDYFVDPAKRDELIKLTRQDQIVNSFEVKMKSPRTGAPIWLDISARVIELSGELALYINLQNITLQKQTEEKLFQEAITDPLTGLYNRRQFETMTSMALATCIRQKKPYCIMMLDIDHFKKVNDTYGHDVGDLVLKDIARVLKAVHRSADIVARYGGEEFVLFLNNSDIQGALIAAERIRTAVRKSVIWANQNQISVTVSLGISVSQNGDVYAMIKEADIALYHSKKTGRDRVSVFSEEMRQESENQ